MKIGMFTDTYSPQINGVVTVIKLLQRELANCGHEVFVFAPSHPNYKDKEIRVYRFPSIKFAFQDEYRVAGLYQRQAFSVFPHLDIVHSHDPFSMGFLAMWVSKRYNIPHLHHYHTLYTEYRHYIPRPIRPPAKVAEKVSAAFCNLCSCVIAPSQKMKEELIRYGVSKPIFPLPFGIDKSEFEGEIKWDVRKELNISGSLLLHTGRLGAEKNIKFLLRAFKQMTRQREMTLVITSGGPQKEELEKHADQLGIKDKVVFTGYLEREKLIDLYRQADLFVFASKTETQGIVLLESMAAGTPVVAIGKMGVLDIVKDKETGILVEEDEEEYAKAVLKLLEDPHRLKLMGEKALLYAHSMSAQKCTEDLVKIYYRLVNKRSP
jgi:glycosyltransferase involved in cell wall biosynthesis